MTELFLYAAGGFVAQMVAGTLGMGYGLCAMSWLMGGGIAPATASATVHAAEVFTTGFSGVSHRYFGNIDPVLFRRLVIPGVIGAAIGAFVLTSLPADRVQPLIAAYLLFMGAILLIKAVRPIAPVAVTRHLTPLGFIGAFVDAWGGGGYGPIVASTLLVRGQNTRTTVGTTNAVQFFVALTASIVFFASLGFSHWRIILGLAIGGALAAPIAAYISRRAPARPVMILAGMLVIVLGGRALFSVMP